MWYSYKARGVLHVTGAGEGMFYSDFASHEGKESPARELDMWLNTNRPVLLQCKLRAKEVQESNRRGADDASGVGDDDGYSSADSFGDGNSIESMAVGSGDGVYDACSNCR